MTRHDARQSRRWVAENAAKRCPSCRVRNASRARGSLQPVSVDYELSVWACTACDSLGWVDPASGRLETSPPRRIGPMEEAAGLRGSVEWRRRRRAWDLLARFQSGRKRESPEREPTETSRDEAA